MPGTNISTPSAAGGMRGTPSSKHDQARIAYPFIPLTDVVKMAQAISLRGGRCRFDDLADALGQQKTSGAFRGRTSAARMYGAVETVGSELVLTELGKAMCSPDPEGDTLAQAFLRVPLYEALHARYAAESGKLPAREVIEADMMRLGVPAKSVELARRAFLRSAEFAGFFRSGRDRLIRPAPMSGSIAPRHVGAPEPTEPTVGPLAEAAPMAEHPLIQGLMAKLPPEGERFTPRQRQRWLDTAKAALDLMYAGEDEDESGLPAGNLNGATSRHPQNA